MDKEKIITKTRSIANRDDLLCLLNEIKGDLSEGKSYPFTRKQLLILCNPKNEKKRYHSFEIPKKTGGFRHICTPNGNLKWFQLCLNEIFKALYSPSPHAMGFTIGRSVVDNARIHTHQNYVFNIDLKDFFTSIDQARVWKRLQLAPFCFTPEVAGVIAGLCSIKSLKYTYNDPFKVCFVLPQGAPTSPLLTNAICDTLDRRLHGLAKRFGLHYSRYADDITFSSMHNVYQPESEFRKELKRIITGQHFTINNEKTRLNHCSSRQEVTGLTVGEKINVCRKYIKDLRAILHIWERYGENAAYASFYPRYKSEKFQICREEINLANVIHGKLCYLKMVKGEHDPVYERLNAQFFRLITTRVNTMQKGNIDYLFTMTKVDFEKKLGIKIEFASRKKDNKLYAHFTFQERYFVVAVSKNLNVDNLPADVQISLTRIKADSTDDTTANKGITQQKTYTVYLLHKPLRNYDLPSNQKANMEPLSSKLKSIIIELAATHPGLDLVDDNGIIESHRREGLLARLVESDFDLSLLP